MKKQFTISDKKISEMKKTDIEKMITQPENLCYCQSLETYKKLVKYCNQLNINFIPDEKKLTIIM
jgi:hypothetical protein